MPNARDMLKNKMGIAPALKSSESSGGGHNNRVRTARVEYDREVREQQETKRFGNVETRFCSDSAPYLPCALRK